MTSGEPFWALVVVVIILFGPSCTDDQSCWTRGPGRHKLLRVLGERFAQSEINLENYQVRKAPLSNPH